MMFLTSLRHKGDRIGYVTVIKVGLSSGEAERAVLECWKNPFKHIHFIPGSPRRALSGEYYVNSGAVVCHVA